MKIIKNVKRYQLYQDILYYYNCDNSNILHIINFHKGLKKIKIEGTSHWLFKDKNYIRNFQGLCLIVKEASFTSLKNEYIEVISDIGIATDYTDSDGRTHKENLFQLPEEIPILKEWLPDSIQYVQNNYWVNDTKEDLKLIDVEKGEVLWTFILPEIEIPYEFKGNTKTKKVLGIYKENLWIQLPDSRILALSLLDGSLKQDILNEEYFCVHQDGISLDSENGKIQILCFDIYIYFDLDSLSFGEELKLQETMLVVKSQLIDKDRLSFTCFLNKSTEPNAYGVFDTSSLEIIFLKEKESDMSYFYQIPQVNNELFTILDYEGNLIVHKRAEIRI